MAEAITMPAKTISSMAGQGTWQLPKSRAKGNPNWMRKFPHIVQSNENYVSGCSIVYPPSAPFPPKILKLMLIYLPLGWHFR